LNEKKLFLDLIEKTVHISIQNFKVIKMKKYIFIFLVIALIAISGCTETQTTSKVITDTQTASKAATVYMNQDVTDEMKMYSNQYTIAYNNYQQAFDNSQIVLTSYNDFIKNEYNKMSYSQQTSSATQMKKNEKADNLRHESNLFIIQCDIFETQNLDNLAFLEQNQNAIKKMDSNYYFNQKSILNSNLAYIRQNRASTQATVAKL
jgi:type III secretory pathway component EscR